MTSYLVCYELVNNTHESYVIDKLKSFGVWGRVIGNTWIIKSERNFVEIRDELAKYMESNDRLLVIKTESQAAWKNILCSNEWLIENV